MKTISMSLRALLFVCSLSFPARYAVASGGDDHSHGNTATPNSNGVNYFSSEAVSDKHELFVKYQPLKAGETAILQLFISDYASNLPLDSISFTITSKEDKSLRFTVTRMDRGFYEVQTVFPENRIYSLLVSFTSSRGPDLLLLQNIEPGKLLPESAQSHSGEEFTSSLLLAGAGLLAGMLIMFVIMKTKYRRVTTLLLIVFCVLPTATWQPLQAHEGHGEASKKGNNFSTSFLVPKETQFLFEVTTLPVQSGSFVASTKLFGTIIPSSSGQAIVQAPQTGKITSLSVHVGQHVAKGQLLATIEPVIDAGNMVTLLTEKNNAEAELTASKLDLNRLKSIEDIAAKREIAEAEARYTKAAENAKLLEGIRSGKASSSRSISLISPISGVVSNFTFTIGSTINANESLLTVTNLSKVYVETQVFDKDADKVTLGQNFLVECATSDVHKTAAVRLLAPAQSINATNQTLRVIFEMDNVEEKFKIGEFVNVRVFATGNSTQLSVPNSAISEINGRPVVFIKDSAERFSVSYVLLGDNNGTHSIILKGVEEPERIVTKATYQMKMIYLNQ